MSLTALTARSAALLTMIYLNICNKCAHIEVTVKLVQFDWWQHEPVKIWQTTLRRYYPNQDMELTNSEGGLLNSEKIEELTLA